MQKNKNLTGGDFLVTEPSADDVFIPEEFNEEQIMIAQTCEDFLQAEVYPMLDRIDKQELGLMRKLLSKAGELGLLGIAIPAEYEGFGQSFLTAMRANEALGAGYSFSVAYSAHVGIGSMPIVYYGTEEQKARYLPKLATGEWTAAYCLTEPNAGSDANAGKTKAVLSEDGKHYILNGQKMWITNGGFADVLTVFAKIDNDRVLSAFVVEARSPGITLNPEENKMGIKGSSTRQIFFNDVKVPAGNLLGRRGEGFRIALNILHMGRIKLGGIVLGAAKRAINQSVNYANERKQFGSLISSFGAIKHKMAEQVIRTFTCESAVYRTSKNIEDTLEENLAAGMDHSKAEIEAIARFSVECALLKVYGSESLDFIVDEAVQIFGGMGYSAEAPIDRAYRDSRINRIFEGTNEINRLLTADTAIKKASKGEFDLFGPAKKVLKAAGTEQPVEVPADYFEEKWSNIRNFKNATLLIIQAFSDKFQKNLVNEQEIMMNIADMMIFVYAAESTLLRVEKLHKIHDDKHLQIYKDILDVFIFDTSTQLYKSGKDALASFEEDEKKMEKYCKSLRHHTDTRPVNVKESRRRIAERLIYDNRYTF